MKIKSLYFILFGFLLAVKAQENPLGALVATKVDSLMTYAIQQQAFPGGQILVAHKNEVVFHKTYGFHTYDSIQAVGLTDSYDLASVTKILGPLPPLMKLVDEGKLNLDVPFSRYWKPWKRRKDKKNLTLREILAHQAGLVPYIVFLNKATKKGVPKNRFIQSEKTTTFSRQAFNGQYVNTRFERKMYRIINRSNVSQDKVYNYSGLTFLIFPKLIEQLTGQPYEQYLETNFYKPLGCTTLKFNPAKKNYPNSIVPTEKDTFWRKALVKGFVHDENAALLGGVSGNAGLFGNADDLVKMLLLYQNFGVLDGKRLLSEATVREFTKIQYPENDNRRGLGFDKPLLGNDTLTMPKAYPSPQASTKSFGHAGFTGTFVWADPENQLVFIFLSNRVYPDRSHRNLYDLRIRQELQDIFYTALK
ncbi:hypothetical protein MTsPCn5_31140 [Croceitalea sp. MTPC5]|uniref:serine hydrolase domain-containing protein n=1 Tax=Croceitalea sp. MTPC5 TaxID=3056565 RepID=UPI002B3B6F0F|nr:hypothetical protein MTsPCn5_31140 [Croceitalea sp. MTPC5]